MKYQQKYLRRIVRIQALFRGNQVRKKLSKKQLKLLNNIEQCNRRATLSGSVSVNKKFNSALADLLKPGYFSKIKNTLVYIDTYAKLLNECCAAMIYDDSCEVIINLIRMSGRDYEWSGVIQLCVSILHTLAKNPVSRDVTLKMLERDVTVIGAKLLVKFQDKSSREKLSRQIFVAICQLLSLYFKSDQHKIESYLNQKDETTRLLRIRKELEEKYKKQVLTSRATSRRSAINFRQPTPRKSINNKENKNEEVKKSSSKYSVREADLETQFRSITEILKLLKLKYK